MALTLPLAADVRLVLGKDATAFPDATADALIADADLIASQCPAIVAADATKQAAVIKYIAAHLAAMSLFPDLAGTMTSRKLGDAAKSFSSAPMGEQLKSSRFGSMAITLDGSGCLANLGRKPATMTMF